MTEPREPRIFTFQGHDDPLAFGLDFGTRTTIIDGLGRDQWDAMLAEIRVGDRIRIRRGGEESLHEVVRVHGDTIDGRRVEADA